MTSHHDSLSMTRFCGVLLLFVASIPMSAAAQDAPQAEIFGGYSFLLSDFRVLTPDKSHGFHLSGALNKTKWFGMAADFSSQYGSDSFHTLDTFNPKYSTQMLTLGPRVSLRKGAVTTFGHAMFGVTWFHQADATGEDNPSVIYPGGTETSAATHFGGGVDVKATENLAVRLFQADYVSTFFRQSRQGHIRLSTGLVIRFGKK